MSQHSSKARLYRVAALRRGGTTADLARALGMHYDTAKWNLARMAEHGMVWRDDAKRWHAVPRDQPDPRSLPFAILCAAQDEPGCRVVSIINDLYMRTTQREVSTHLVHLRNAGLVEPYERGMGITLTERGYDYVRNMMGLEEAA